MPVPSLRDAATSSALIGRIEALSAQATAGWGKMTGAQMLAHCQFPFRAAFGELDKRRGILGFLLGGFAKKKWIDTDLPFGKNSPTDPDFVVRGTLDFEEQRRELTRLVQRFARTGATTDKPHPFFGSLSQLDWDRLMWKHLDHHLRQFGV